MIESRQFRVYRQKFASPIMTAHGQWNEKEAIILRKEDSKGKVSFGEISLVNGFTFDSLNDLLPRVENWCAKGEIGENILIQSAVSSLDSEIWDFSKGNQNYKIKTAKLFRKDCKFKIGDTIKVKIGIRNTEDEVKNVKGLIQQTGSGCKLRLDANEGIEMEDLLLWDEAFKENKEIEFLEQPFSGESIGDLLKIQSLIDLPLALDESIVWLQDLSYFCNQKWLGKFIIKPCLMPNWDRTISFISSNSEKTIVSTSFESPFGYEAVLRCACYSNRVAGLDRKLFSNCEGEFSQHHEEILIPYSVSVEDLDNLWASL